jgi:hypothetical protein
MSDELAILLLVFIAAPGAVLGLLLLNGLWLGSLYGIARNWRRGKFHYAVLLGLAAVAPLTWFAYVGIATEMEISRLYEQGNREAKAKVGSIRQYPSALHVSDYDSGMDDFFAVSGLMARVDVDTIVVPRRFIYRKSTEERCRQDLKSISGTPLPSTAMRLAILSRCISRSPLEGHGYDADAVGIHLVRRAKEYPLPGWNKASFGSWELRAKDGVEDRLIDYIFRIGYERPSVLLLTPEGFFRSGKQLSSDASFNWYQFVLKNLATTPGKG